MHKDKVFLAIFALQTTLGIREIFLIFECAAFPSMEHVPLKGFNQYLN